MQKEGTGKSSNYLNKKQKKKKEGGRKEPSKAQGMRENRKSRKILHGAPRKNSVEIRI